MISEADYQRTLIDRNLDYRQWLVNQIDISDISHLFESVRYEDVDATYKGYTLAMCTFPSPDAINGIKGTRSRLVVYPPAFAYFGTLRNLTAAILDHEGRHGAQFFARPDIFLAEGSDDLREIDAYLYQLERANYRPVSTEYFQTIRRGIDGLKVYTEEIEMLNSLPSLRAAIINP